MIMRFLWKMWRESRQDKNWLATTTLNEVLVERNKRKTEWAKFQAQQMEKDR